jgi:hypothetical protein
LSNHPVKTGKVGKWQLSSDQEVADSDQIVATQHVSDLYENVSRINHWQIMDEP